MHSDAYLKRYTENHNALQYLEVGTKKNGWSIVHISYCSPWGYVLLRSPKGIVTRQSPRGVLENHGYLATGVSTYGSF